MILSILFTAQSQFWLFNIMLPVTGFLVWNCGVQALAFSSLAYPATAVHYRRRCDLTGGLYRRGRGLPRGRGELSSEEQWPSWRHLQPIPQCCSSAGEKEHCPVVRKGEVGRNSNSRGCTCHPDGVGWACGCCGGKLGVPSTPPQRSENTSHATLIWKQTFAFHIVPWIGYNRPAIHFWVLVESECEGCVSPSSASIHLSWLACPAAGCVSRCRLCVPLPCQRGRNFSGGDQVVAVGSLYLARLRPLCVSSSKNVYAILLWSVVHEIPEVDSEINQYMRSE